MRKHSVRKWIHAICDLLPLLVIPIFALAVRSDNNFTPIEVQQNNDIVVDFNQVFDVVPDTVNNSFSVVEQDTIVINVDTLVYPYLDVDFIDDNIYVVRCFDKTGEFDTCNLWNSAYNQQYNFNTGTEYRFTCSNTPYLFQFKCDIGSSISFNLFNLTQMFGSGNEPTLTDFDTYFPLNDYSYTLSQDVLLKNVGVTTYNDTDVGSQMVYTLYQTTDKYFNFNNVGVFGTVYDWFELNIMHGTAPMSFYIVWNVILFEFIMDLIFLTYMLFMFIIDFTECMIDRFFEKSYRGGR